MLVDQHCFILLHLICYGSPPVVRYLWYPCGSLGGFYNLNLAEITFPQRENLFCSFFTLNRTKIAFPQRGRSILFVFTLRSKKFFSDVLQKKIKKFFFQAIYKILTIQKIVLSSSRGQGNFQGLEASRPSPRTSKCVLEDSISHKCNGEAYSMYYKSILRCNKMRYKILHLYTN